MSKSESGFGRFAREKGPKREKGRDGIPADADSNIRGIKWFLILAAVVVAAWAILKFVLKWI